MYVLHSKIIVAFCFHQVSSTKIAEKLDRDASDIGKLTQWFDNQPPFLRTEKIMSIATGIVGDNTVLCHDAVTIDKRVMAKIKKTCH